MIEIRPSSLGINAACHASVVAPTVKINTSGDPARMGSAVHSFMAAKVGDPDAVIDFAALAKEFEVDPDELQPSAWQSWKAWLSVAEFFPNPQTEVHLGPYVWSERISIQGTADLLSRPTTSLLRIGDYKGSWTDGDHELQIKAYAFLAYRKWSREVENVEGIVLNTRLGFKHVYRWKAQELDAWFNRLAESIHEGIETFSPSASTCKFCRRAFECPARHQLVKSCAETVLSVNVAELTPDLAAELLVRARLIANAADDAVEIVRAEVASHGGSMLLSDGRTLQLTPSPRRSIKPEPAWPILVEELGERLVETLKISKTVAEGIVGDKAPKKMKGKAKAAFVDRLEKAGALETTITERLEIVKAPAGAVSVESIKGILDAPLASEEPDNLFPESTVEETPS